MIEGNISILGPSGSGKTTLLRQVMKANPRGCVMLFQDLALWPHLTALQHIKLVNHHIDAEYALEKVAMAHRRHAYPRQLSGGERQRLAIARALAVKPNLLLLDEPLTSLDLPQKIAILDLILASQSEIQFSILHVTHDPCEAFHLSSVIYLLEAGKLIWNGDHRAFMTSTAVSVCKLRSAMQTWNRVS